MFKPKSVIGILFALGAAFMTFCNEMDNQKKNKQLEDMERRISCLEKKGE